MFKAVRLIAGVTIAALLFAAFVPGFDWLHATPAGPGWILLPDTIASWLPTLTSISDDQPLSLQALAPPRGPPEHQG